MTWSHVVLIVSLVLLVFWLDEITKKLRKKKQQGKADDEKEIS